MMLPRCASGCAPCGICCIGSVELLASDRRAQRHVPARRDPGGRRTDQAARCTATAGPDLARPPCVAPPSRPATGLASPSSSVRRPAARHNQVALVDEVPAAEHVAAKPPWTDFTHTGGPIGAFLYTHLA